MPPRVVLVTGSSTGFGRALVEAILANGDIAIATLRKPSALDDLSSKYGPDRLVVLPLDVAKVEQVDSVFATIKERFGGLDAVVNNAGISAFGEVEGTDEQKTRELFETNFFGLLNITHKAVAFFRNVNPTRGGSVVQISSNAGVKAIPGLGVYSATKAAVEAVSDALNDELDPAWNIKVTVVEPGAFRTNLVNNVAALAPHPAYSSPSLAVNQFRAALADWPIKGDPTKAAKVILKLFEVPAQDRPRRLVLGEDALETIKIKAKELLELAEKDEIVAASVNLNEFQ
ncbi:hypothetical protein JCM10213_005149 [Rhodosporidiobolus nylandii]